LRATHSNRIEWRRPARRLIMGLFLAGGFVAGSGEASPEAGTARDWPTWSGPNRDMTSLGNGLFEEEGFGLEKVWSRPLGSAYSGISVVDGHVVTGFSDGESDYLVSLAAVDGQEQWRYRISKTYKGHDGSDDGPLATPMIADGTVYGLGAWGDLFALSLNDGKKIWAHQLVESLGARKPEYGFSTTPTVVDDMLVIEASIVPPASFSGRLATTTSAISPLWFSRLEERHKSWRLPTTI